MTVDLGKQGTLVELAQLVGISHQALSDMRLESGPLGDMLRAYCSRLRAAASGHRSLEPGSLDLVQERAALAKEQRVGLEIKNSVLRGEYASVALLAEVLANASQSVAERFDHLPGLLRKLCPDMQESDREQIFVALANARNEWVRTTVELVQQALAEAMEEDEVLDESPD